MLLKHRGIDRQGIDWLSIPCILIIVFVTSIGIVDDALAQQITEDVVYLKDGSIIRGIIVEQIPNKSLRIRTQGGVEIKFKMSDVLQITKALPMSQLGSSKEKSSLTAFTLSALCFGYGYGQVYNGQYLKAGVHLVVASACFGIIMLSDSEPDDSITPAHLGLLIGIGNWGYSMFDAYSSAKKINEQNRQQQSASLLSNLAPYISSERSGVVLSFRF